MLSVVALLAVTPTTASAQGWYLLGPVPYGSLELDSDAPLSKWWQLGSYDTAAQCEADKTRKTTEIPLRQDDTENMRELKLFFFKQRMLSLCISAADPRLPPKATR
jgi:hypothetical protein